VCVSLQGTFDTLPVMELFGLLASAAKTGALRLEAGDHEASVFLSGGLCCAVDTDDTPAPVAASDAELAARLVDVGFAFARLASGSFRFSDSDLAEYDTGVTTPLEPAVIEIRSLLDQWREIEATIPSLDVRVRLAPVLRDAEVVVTAREWSLLVALEGTPTIRELVARCTQPMMEVCRDLKGLVDRGAVEIGAAVPDDRATVEIHVPEGRVPEGRAAAEPTTNGVRRGAPESTVSLLEPSEPYAPDAYVPEADEFVTAEDAAAAAADADAVAAGIVRRMARSRTSMPDVFASHDDQPTEVPVTGAAATAGISATHAGEPHADATMNTAKAADRAEAATDPEEALPDRGALLRLFSALKEN
jgi:Domain of unknown function (DUF4388)